MLESGAASLTLAVMTSPKPARSPRSPPRGKMHCNLRAPLLSATSNMVRIPIMTFLLKTLGAGAARRDRSRSQARAAPLLLHFLQRFLHARVGAFLQCRMFDTHLNGFSQNIAELPPLPPAQ